MSGPSCFRTSFDFAAAPRSCSRSNVPTAGMSRSMMYLRSAMICPSGGIGSKNTGRAVLRQATLLSLPQEEHSPQADQNEIAHREHREAMEDVVVGYMNECLCHTKCDICPANFESDCIDAI